MYASSHYTHALVKVEKTKGALDDAKLSRLLIEQFESELETLYKVFILHIT
jgi:hypothetical protein